MGILNVLVALSASALCAMEDQLSLAAPLDTGADQGAEVPPAKPERPQEDLSSVPADDGNDIIVGAAETLLQAAAELNADSATQSSTVAPAAAAAPAPPAPPASVPAAPEPAVPAAAVPEPAAAAPAAAAPAAAAPAAAAPSAAVPEKQDLSPEEEAMRELESILARTAPEGDSAAPSRGVVVQAQAQEGGAGGGGSESSTSTTTSSTTTSTTTSSTTTSTTSPLNSAEKPRPSAAPSAAPSVLAVGLAAAGGFLLSLFSI
ncbi:hypothetical protein, conserved [Eimeria necatrix]|uniref:Uncharacterized protein n=1 Tax=Eimeria necatrix TaxID=51315 RepID=U6N085_9EIME|nr:hypothetical protein, conserved [Eimeria necatrix]CDJ69898.1 hypothetical protein, conserved [Eimeria necatrix]